MKKLILSISLICIAFLSYGQFRMVGNASGSWITVNDSTYLATVNFQSDLTGNGYLATQIPSSGYRIFTGTEQIYIVTSATGQTFSSAVLTIEEYEGDHGPPIGQVMCYNPDGKATIPQVPFGPIGATGQMQAAIDSYNARLTSGIYFGSGPLNQITTVTVAQNSWLEFALPTASGITGRGLRFTTGYSSDDSTNDYATFVGANDDSLKIFNADGGFYISHFGTNPLIISGGGGLLFESGVGIDNQGLFRPRNVSTTIRNSFTSVAAGSLIWNTDSLAFEVFNGFIWEIIGSGGSQSGSFQLISEKDRLGGYAGLDSARKINSTNIRPTPFQENIPSSKVTVNSGEFIKVKYKKQTLSSQKTVIWDTEKSSFSEITLTQNTKIIPINHVDGSTYKIQLNQDNTGNHLVDWGGFANVPDDQLPSYPGSSVTLVFESNGFTLSFDNLIDNSVGGENEKQYREWNNEYGLIYWLNPNMHSLFSQENASTGTKTYNPSFIGDTIQSCFALGKWAGLINTPRGLLQSDSDYGNNILLRSTSAGGDAALNGDSLDFILKREFSFFFRIKADQDATSMDITDNNRGTGGETGIMIRRNSSGNTIRVFITDNTFGTIADVTGLNLTVSDGWVDLVVRCDGDSLQVIKKRLSDGVETSMITEFTPTTTVNPAFSYNITLFRRASSNDVEWFGRSAAFMLFTKYLTDAAITDISTKLATLPVTFTKSVFTDANSNNLEPNQVSSLYAWYDFSDTTYLWQDLAQTARSTANDDDIGLVNTKGGYQSAILDSMVLGSFTKPSLETSVQNGLNAARFESTEGLRLNSTTGYFGTDVTVVLVGKVDTTAGGNNYFIGPYQNNFGTGVMATGNSNPNNATIGRPHANFNIGSSEFSPLGNQGTSRVVLPPSGRHDEWYIIEWRAEKVDSFFRYEISVNGQNKKAGIVKQTGKAVDLVLNNIGAQFAGYIGEVQIYNGYLDDKTISALRNRLTEKWGINNVNPGLTTDITAGYEGDYTIVVDENNSDYSIFSGSDIDFHGMASGITVNDTIWVTWNMRQDHNTSGSFDDNHHGVVAQAFNVNTLKPLIDPIYVAKDYSGADDYIRNDPGVSIGPNGNLFFGAMSNKITAGDRERFQIYRELNRSDLTWVSDTLQINSNDLQWYGGPAPMFFDSLGNWYHVGYGEENNVGDYDLFIYRSTDSGSTWANYLGGTTPVIQGELIGNVDPEEPVMLQASWGEWILAYRVDDDASIRLVIKDNLSDFLTPQNDTTTHIRVGLGNGKPYIYEDSYGVLWALGRGLEGSVSIDSIGTTAFAAMTYSIDRGRTWATPFSVDRPFSSEENRSYVYGFIYQQDEQTICPCWASEYRFPSGSSSIVCSKWKIRKLIPKLFKNTFSRNQFIGQ